MFTQIPETHPKARSPPIHIYLIFITYLLSLLSQGLMVHQEFVDMVQEINHARPFQAEYGVVSQGKNIEGTIDRWVENYLL